MRFILDTHTFLWYSTDDARLSEYAAEILEGENQPVLSIVSPWEISIKVSVGKLELDTPISALVGEALSLGFELLPITPEHLDILSSLPFHHRDPFDRTLVAQCIHEKLPLLSKDATLDAYAIKRLW